MAIKVTKPAINVREELNTLKFDRVPFQKMPAGSVLQVVSSGTIAEMNTTAHQTWVSSNTTLNITPRFLSSKILVQMTQKVRIEGGSSYAQLRAAIRLTRGSTVIWNTADMESVQTRYSESGNELDTILPVLYLDSPATTEEITYALECRKHDGDRWRLHGSDKGTTVVLMEIAG